MIIGVSFVLLETIKDAPASVGNQSSRLCRGRHRTVSAAASRRHVDASLELFAIWTKQTRERYEREESSPRARRLFADGGSLV